MENGLKKGLVVKTLSSVGLLAVGFLAGFFFPHEGSNGVMPQAGKKLSYVFAIDDIPQQRIPNTGFVAEVPEGPDQVQEEPVENKDSLNAGGG